jgi:hypothetical protein
MKTNDSESESIENVIRGNCYNFLTDWVPTDTLLIPRCNVASLSSEIELNEISNNIRCQHINKGSFLQTFECVTRVKY